MILPVKTSTGEYNVVLERGALSHIKDYLSLNRKALIVTDSGVPTQYAEAVSCQYQNNAQSLLLLQ